MYENDGKVTNKDNKVHESNDKFNLDFCNPFKTNKLVMKVNGNTNIYFKIDKDLKDLEKKKNTLTFEQKKCLIFLGLAVKSKLSCIIQGPTGVG